MNSARSFALPIIGFIMLALFELSRGQSITAPSPAPIGPPSNDGAAIDQGVAYVLLVVALAITYLVH
ncbi:unnamed protein product [Coffea canephora]|uniref:Arabinogalactan peptide 22 n=1 Tax=Coffea canephora TaxID=49390 RepID=A0A068U472_COFCA|nr:unnamed protein product [Coffea canephora]